MLAQSSSMEPKTRGELWTIIRKVSLHLQSLFSKKSVVLSMRKLYCTRQDSSDDQMPETVCSNCSNGWRTSRAGGWCHTPWPMSPPPSQKLRTSHNFNFLVKNKTKYFLLRLSYKVCSQCWECGLKIWARMMRLSALIKQTTKVTDRDCHSLSSWRSQKANT